MAAALNRVRILFSILPVGYIGVALFCVFFCAPPSVAQHDPLLKGGILVSSTQLVAVPVSVTNQLGNFVPGLTQTDFRIWQDGRSQNITFFQQQDTPVTIGLVVDHSGSMSKKLPSVAAAVYQFAHLSNPQDQVFVIDFADTFTFEPLDGHEFTSDPQVLERAVSSVSASGETALYDAVVAGLSRLNQGRWPKKALIIVSDGGDNVSHFKSWDVLHMARRSHAVIYALGLVSTDGADENPGVLKHLAGATGGIALFPNRTRTIDGISEEIALDIRSSYMIGYIPPQNSRPGSYHKIRVQVDAPGLRKLHIRARPGFVTSKASSGGDTAVLR